MPTLDLIHKSEDGSTKPIKFTYSGGSPDDSGPQGALLKMMIATVTGDVATAEQYLDEKSKAMPRSGPPAGDVEVNLGTPTVEGPFTIIPSESKADGQAINLPFHMVQENGAWKVDMATSIEKMMGGMMELMQQAMSGLGEGMAKIMDGVGEAMNTAFSGEAPSSTSSPTGNGHDDSADSDKPTLPKRPLNPKP